MKRHSYYGSLKVAGHIVPTSITSTGWEPPFKKIIRLRTTTMNHMIDDHTGDYTDSNKISAEVPGS